MPTMGATLMRLATARPLAAPAAIVSDHEKVSPKRMMKNIATTTKNSRKDIGGVEVRLLNLQDGRRAQRGRQHADLHAIQPLADEEHEEQREQIEQGRQRAAQQLHPS